MTYKPELKARFDEVRYSQTPVQRMMLERDGESPIFAAEIIAGEEGKELLCIWPSRNTARGFKRIVSNHADESIEWRQGRHTLWGRMEHGEFSLEVVPFGSGWARRATRLVELPQSVNGNMDSTWEIIARVASASAIKRGLLNPEVVRENLKNFVESHSR